MNYGRISLCSITLLILHQGACKDSTHPVNKSGDSSPKELANERASLESAVERMGGRVFPDRVEKGGWYVQLIGSHLRASDLTQLSKYPNIVRLALSDSNAEDEVMADVATLRDVRVLYLSNTRVTDKGIAKLFALPRLQELFLDHTGIHGSAFECIARLESLRVLWIDESQATHAALPEFDRHRSLNEVMMMQENGFVSVWARGTGGGGHKAKYWTADR